MNPEVRKKLQEKFGNVRTGGKGTVRRKKKKRSVMIDTRKTPEEKEFINASTVPLVINDLINGKNPKVDLIRAENSLKMIIGAIQSSIKGNRVKWEEIIDQGIRIS